MGVILIDFRSITMGFGFINLVLAIILLLFVRKIPFEPLKEVKRSSSNIDQLIQIPQFWLGVIYFGTNFGAFLAFSSLWNIPDSLAYGHSLKTATIMSATLRFGGALGAALSGILINYVGRLSILIKGYSTGAVLLGGLLIFGPIYPVYLTFILMGLFGFFCGGTALGFPFAQQHIPPHLKGIGFGFMTFFGYFLCGVLEYLIGVLLAHLHLSNSIDTFKVVLAPLVLILVIGWIATLHLKETYKKL